jgi:Ca-activated chloride channel family protein
MRSTTKELIAISTTGFSSQGAGVNPGRWCTMMLVALILWAAGGTPLMALSPAPRIQTLEDGPEHHDAVMATSPFLLTGTDVQTVISGPVASVNVTQTWSNPNAFPVDGLYIFPLPENAAVNGMSLQIGDRFIQGRMHRREEAQAIYQEARRQGRVAGLLDQERDNVFVQQVANIMPGASIAVTLTFDHAVSCEDNGCSYVFPTVVGPRFVPAHQGDPGRIDPPIVDEGASTGQNLSISVELDGGGVVIADLQSPSHRIQVTRLDDARARVNLTGDTRLNRDYELRWNTGGTAPQLGLLAWRDPDSLHRDDPWLDESSRGESSTPSITHHAADGNFTLILQPPTIPALAQAAPRELVFVLDCSGSMSGVPITAAKNVVRQALGSLRPRDTFQIIRFSEQASGLGAAPLTPSAANLQRARLYLDGLQGQGGTQMVEGIRAALGRPADPERLRIVAFLTDGYIGNETEILAEVSRLLGSARMFSFGIGSSVNRYLLEGLAEEGRGAAAFMGPRESPDEMVARFVRRIETPVLTDIRISFEGLEVADLEPGRIPDLFAGQSLLIHGRYTRPQSGVVIVEGNRNGRREILSRVAVLPEVAHVHAALGRLWARARIHRLQREMHSGQRPDLIEAITRLGLGYRLMTPWTSLVAVDSSVSNPYGPATQLTVPVEMPEDVAYEGIFGYSSGDKKVKIKGMSPSATPAALQEHDAASSRVRSEQAAAGRNQPSLRKMPYEEMARKDDELAVQLFKRLTLNLDDGTDLVLEASGELWHLESSRRTLVEILTFKQLARVEDLLRKGGLENAVAGNPDHGSQDRGFLIETPAGMIRMAPASSQALEQLATMLAGLAGL